MTREIETVVDINMKKRMKGRRLKIAEDNKSISKSYHIIIS